MDAEIDSVTNLLNKTEIELLTFNAQNTSQSSWLLIRLLNSFYDAISEQARQADIPGNRSKSMISYCVSPFAAICMSTATCLNRIVIFASSRQNKKLPIFSKILLRLIAIYILFQGSYGLIVCLKIFLNDNSINNINNNISNSNSNSINEFSILNLLNLLTNNFIKNLIPNYYNFNPNEFFKYKFFGMSYSLNYYVRLLLDSSTLTDDTITAASAAAASAATSATSFATSATSATGNSTTGNSTIENTLITFDVLYKSINFLNYKNSSNGGEDNSSKILTVSPTPTVLKPFYLSLCLSQILETFISVTSGNDPSVENGLTLFEYSLAFQEVQSAKRLSIELIIISIFSILNHLTIHLLGLFNLEKFRLIPSTIIGLSTLSYYFLTILNGKIMQIPFIIIMGYLPQLITLFIIIMCLSIFLLVAIFKGSLTDLNLTTISNNFESFNINLSDDFYTALINSGTFLITATSKNSYFKEFNSMNLPLMTWLEFKNLNDFNNMKSSIINNSKKKLIKDINGYNNEIIEHPDLLLSKKKYNIYSNNIEYIDIDGNEIMNKDNLDKNGLIINKFKNCFKLIFNCFKIFLRFNIINIYSIFKKISKKNKDDDNNNNEVNENDENDEIKNDINTNNNDLGNDTVFEYTNLPEEEEEDDDEYEDTEIEIDDDLNEPYEFNSDCESDIEYINNNDKDEFNIKNKDTLITLNELKNLIIPTNHEDLINSRILFSHLIKDKINTNEIITRSKFNSIYQNSSTQLMDLIKEKRQFNKFENTINNNKDKNKNNKNNDLNNIQSIFEMDLNHNPINQYMIINNGNGNGNGDQVSPSMTKSEGECHYENEFDDELNLGDCVICHTNSRQIILWPCKCLSICEGCRVSLVIRGFNECVCCRRKVEGYSKVYIP
ncbi:hypothetical protein B5S29_g4805 [[Candida] boidinii]|nr:hypothetical protein B5S29_g4805 [[Candida] boidinii]